MTLLKCPRCKRDISVEVKGQTEALQCEQCGHVWENRPVTRRIAGGNDLNAPDRITRVAEVRAQVQQPVAHVPVHEKRDTPKPADEDYRAGRLPLRIKGYEILECRGKGGMGKVYRAVQQSLGREVAIKTLDSNLARNQASIWRFTKEAAAMAQLRHPNILYVIDRGKERNIHYFVMEYVDGPSLREMLRERRSFTPHEALHIMLQLARTMAYAHKQGVVHRDLKPENILYNSDKCLKVADFGLAGVNRETTYIKQLTKSYVSMGTECYMAPEQKQDAKKVDHRADIYSMGVMLYELIRGELPFPSLPPSEHVIVEGRNDIDAIIRCAMCFDREERYPTTEALVTALEHALENGSKEAQADNRDTVADTPGLMPLLPIPQRMSEWRPEEYHPSPSPEDYRTDISAFTARRWLWPGFIFLAIVALVVVFFMKFAPQVKPASVSERDRWMRLTPKSQNLSSEQIRYHFPFSGTLQSTWLWGQLPALVWKEDGNWFAHDKQLHQNTFQQEFVRNRKMKWALYQEKIGVKGSFSYQARMQFLPPWHSGTISQSEYQDKHHRSSLPVAMGLEWRGGTTGVVRAILSLQSQRLGLRLESGLPTQQSKLCKWEEDASYTWKQWVAVGLQFAKGQVVAMVQGNKLCHLDVADQSVSEVQPGLLCQNAHCVFEQVEIHASTKTNLP